MTISSWFDSEPYSYYYKNEAHSLSIWNKARSLLVHQFAQFVNRFYSDIQLNLMLNWKPKLR